MNYVLSKKLLAGTPEYEISDGYYKSLIKAKGVLVEILRIEESYEALLSHYKDLEKVILDISMEHLLTRSFDYEETFNFKIQVNTKLVGFLSGARLYIDQLKSRVNKVNPGADYKLQAEALFSEKYDSSFYYRFVEALRNYSAHRGLPIHAITFSSGLDSDDFETAQYQHGIKFYSSKEVFLKEGSGFKRLVLDEMEEKVDILKSIRVYVELLSSVNVAVRALLAKESEQARWLIEDAIYKYQNETKEKPLGLMALQKENGVIKSEIPLSLKWDNVRISLQEKNKNLVNLSRRYVSSKLD